MLRCDYRGEILGQISNGRMRVDYILRDALRELASLGVA